MDNPQITVGEMRKLLTEQRPVPQTPPPPPPQPAVEYPKEPEFNEESPGSGNLCIKVV